MEIGCLVVSMHVILAQLYSNTIIKYNNVILDRQVWYTLYIKDIV
jgi:transcription initiation factor IIE alpha subunit